MTATRAKPLHASAWAALLACAVWLHALPALATNALNSVSVSTGAEDSQIIRLQLRDALDAEPIAFATSNPHRLVIDFPRTSPASGRVRENLNSGVIRDYQVVPAGDRTRVVFNLYGPASHQVRRERNMLFVVLKDERKQTTPDTIVTPTRFAEQGAPRPHSIRDVDFRRGANGESRIVVSLSDPGVGIDIQQRGRAIQVDFLNTSLPPALQRRLDVSDFATPAQTIETYVEGRHTRMMVMPKGRWDYASHQTGNQFVMEIRSLDEPTVARDAKPQYQGEKLTLNFQNVEIRAVLQVIADFTGLNIIASDTVGGNLTLRLKDVPWDQALDIIMRAKGLDKRVSGNVIWVAPRDELAAKERQELEARKAVADLEPLITRSYRLNYVKANEATVVLAGGVRAAVSDLGETATCSPGATGISGIEATGAAAQAQQQGTQTSPTRVLSSRGGSSYDLTTNTLIVTDTAERHSAVEEVIKGIDVPSRQVMIEARIVIADDKWGRNLGARLGYQGSGKIGNTGIGAGSYASSATAAISGITAAAPTSNVDLSVPSAGSIGFSIFNASAAAILSLELQALELDNRGKIVSNPRVVTTNLRPAVIMQGEQIPFQTVSQSGTQTSFKDAVLCLLVAPQVLNNDAIILNVEVTKDAKGETTTAGPAINVKRVKTQVRVNNGETAVLGGIFEQTTRNDTDKVPLLGDIPVLGHLFKRNQREDSKTEMLIFLTPRILMEDAGL
jgi:type IV pilus assembly protein PilQ